MAFGRYPEDPPTEAFSFIIVFSAAVFGFEKADITVETELQTGTGTATLKALSPVGRLARTYTATIELPAQASGTVRLIVHANAAETDLGRIDPSEDIASRPIAFTTLPVAKTEAKTPKRKVVIQCPVGWVKLDGFAKRNRRVLLYEVNLEMDLHNRVSIYKPASVAIYVHPDEGLENLEGWKLQVATPYNRHKAYLLTAENSVVVASKMEGVAGGFAFIENPEETPFPMTEMGFAGTTVPGFDYRLYDDTGRRVDFGIACYKRGDISHVLKNMEDPSVFRKVDLETFDWDAHYLRSEWTVSGSSECTGSPIRTQSQLSWEVGGSEKTIGKLAKDFQGLSSPGRDNLSKGKPPKEQV